MTAARAAVFEIVERRKKPDSGSLGESIVVPNMVRVNGAEILIPSDEPITVHEISSNDVIKVTLTVFARRIFIGAEHVEDEILTAVDAARKELADAHRAYADSMSNGTQAIARAQSRLAEAHRELAEQTSRPSSEERLQRMGLLPRDGDETGEVAE